MAPVNGELIWYRQGGRVRIGVYLVQRTRAQFGDAGRKQVRFSSLEIPWLKTNRHSNIVYRHPIRLFSEGNQVLAGPVYAILAGASNQQFSGSRLNFRDIMAQGRAQNEFVYVLPADSANETNEWVGYVRLGYQKWLPVPCPHPEAVYNRIPLRNLERTPQAIDAKRILRQKGIPIYNPDYFNKQNIYTIIRNAGLDRFLPETSPAVNASELRRMLRAHKGVYMKPTGGSVGHGMIQVRTEGRGYRVQVLKNGVCQTYNTDQFTDVWRLTQQNRVPGYYVLQASIPLLKWKGRPCDFRVLLQKHQGVWRLIGRGVRVAGPNTITTHVPNGGYIANADKVLETAFGTRAAAMDSELKWMVLQCAEAIDRHYQETLGEMSMDIGIDEAGNLWFFEANAKPMKFDEPEIHRGYVEGVLSYLGELRAQRHTGSML